MEEMINEENNNADLRISSSIFYNFFDQIRVGLNSKILIEKCHFSECRNNSIYLVNPCSALIRNNTITRAGQNALLCEWLPYSHWQDKTRKLHIIKNEIQMSTNNGIYICSQDNIFSAHNLKISISQNNSKKNGSYGVRIEDLVINDLQIILNDLDRNEFGGLLLSKVHQKSNKFKFLLQDTRVCDTNNGPGVILKDVGINIIGCKMSRNSFEGIHIDGHVPMPQRVL